MPYRWGLSLKNRKYSVHRVIWMVVNGEIPDGLVIDHLDRDPFNNKLINLALKTSRGNQQNKNKQSNNKTGFTGVSRKMYKECDYFIAAYKDVKSWKYIRKSFSINKFGEEIAFKLACDYRVKAIAQMNALGASYTETHGE